MGGNDFSARHSSREYEYVYYEQFRGSRGAVRTLRVNMIKIESIPLFGRYIGFLYVHLFIRTGTDRYISPFISTGTCTSDEGSRPDPARLAHFKK